MIRLSPHTLARGLAIAGSSWFLAACSSDLSPTAPTVTSAEAMQLQQESENASTIGELTSVSTLSRTTRLQQSVSASALLGPKGGTLSIPSLGVSLEVPAGALSSTVRLTMTALPGDAIAYDLAPQGLSFAVPLRLQQRLSDTDWTPAATLEGANFNSISQVNPQGSEARVSAKLRAWLTGSSVSIYFKKASGYLVSMS